MGNSQNNRRASMGGGASQPSGGGRGGNNTATVPNGIFGGQDGRGGDVRNTNELTAEQLQLLIQAGRLQYGGGGNVNVNDIAGAGMGSGNNAPTPQFRSAKVTKNPFNLKKNSIRMKESSSGGRCIEFDFDAAEPCIISLYYFSREYVTPEHLTVKFALEPGVQQALVVPPVTFEAGMNQTYTIEHTMQHGFDFESVSDDIIYYSQTSTCYPVIIDLRSITDTTPHQFRTAQTTFLTLDPSSTKLKTLKQKVSVGGQAYELHDIYGISSNVGKLCRIVFSLLQT
jgi:hypothetical protein